MARTEAGTRLTVTHRQQQLALRAATLRDLLRLWPMLDPLDLSSTTARWSTAAALLARQRHQESGALSATYFRLFRTAEQIPGSTAVAVAQAVPIEDAIAALRGAALSGIINARRAGQSPQAAARNGLVKTVGAMTKLVLSGSWQTILGATERDRQALGWQRTTSGSPCAFCRMLASRGAVYKTRQSAGFESHNGCSCGVEPYYEGSRLSDEALTFRAEWQQAQREAAADGELRRGTSNDALNAYRRSLPAG